MASILPRGVPSPQESKPPGELSSPSSDLNLTIQKVLDTNASLEEKVKELEGDKKHFQNKLEEYIRYDKEEGGNRESQSTASNSQLERQISELMAEKAGLKAELLKKEEETGDLYSSQQPSISERGHRAHLLQRLNELQATSRLSQDFHSHQTEMLKWENSRLREEVEGLNHYGGKTSGHERPPSWELARPYQHLYSNTERYSSLPESLPSHSSTASGQSGDPGMPNLATLHLTSNMSHPLDSNAAATAAELKKIKKQLEKYKTANIELDQKLKDAKLELQRYAERRTEGDVGYRMDLERLRSENAQLRSQLDRALSEASHLRSLVGRRY